MSTTAMDFDFADTVSAVLDLTLVMIIITVAMIVTEQIVAMMVLALVVEGQAMMAVANMQTLMTAVVGIRVAAAVPAAAP